MKFQSIDFYGYRIGIYHMKNSIESEIQEKLIGRIPFLNQLTIPNLKDHSKLQELFSHQELNQMYSIDSLLSNQQIAWKKHSFEASSQFQHRHGTYFFECGN